jgi:hypothetical protein
MCVCFFSFQFYIDDLADDTNGQADGRGEKELLPPARSLIIAIIIIIIYLQ